jgi:hypothetical protein
VPGGGKGGGGGRGTAPIKTITNRRLRNAAPTHR